MVSQEATTKAETIPRLQFMKKHALERKKEVRPQISSLEGLFNAHPRPFVSEKCFLV